MASDSNWLEYLANTECWDATLDDINTLMADEILKSKIRYFKKYELIQGEYDD